MADTASKDMYDGMVAVNQGLSQALDALTRLAAMEASVPRLSRFVPDLRLTIEEARAYFNFEIYELLRDCAERDWAHFGKLRREQDSRSRLPPSSAR